MNEYIYHIIMFFQPFRLKTFVQKCYHFTQYFITKIVTSTLQLGSFKCSGFAEAENSF